MEFKVFFSDVKKRILDGTDVPYFFRDLIVMITNVKEEDWGTPKDPSTKLAKESTLRMYAKRVLSKKFTQSIVYRLKPELFVRQMKKRPKAILKSLVEDYKPYDSSTDETNIAQKLAECFAEIIRSSAGLVELGVLEEQK